MVIELSSQNRKKKEKKSTNTDGIHINRRNGKRKSQTPNIIN